MNVVASLCHRFPEAALVARRFLDKSSKRAAETKPRKQGHAFDPAKLVHYLHETNRRAARRSEIKGGQFSHGQSNPTFTVRWATGPLSCGSSRGGKLSRARTTSAASSNLRAILVRRACRRRTR